ncbi:ABC transporter ATP-binding protein [Pullulanibacillus sp. KACC 23026]|uniref:ABC transporter ATP-binding protein n=1 Tax=Pullulanibacillus sp. KACC 23026 TaxID=3028315 RepID=UPI0023AEE414|nr:ABC transporter ATP-binding protein [Pullulanibacillus sp. KACC 23026]WEG12095.1 ABC transporter ATP-binding protein [Pullulanibacillus sp. KACC 23026]
MRGLGGGKGWELRELAKQEHFDWAIIQRVGKSFRTYWKKAVFVSILLLITSAGGALPAWLTQQIIDEGILKGHVSTVIWLTSSLILIALITGLLGVAQSWLSNSVAQDVMADYRLSLFSHIQRQTVNFFASRQTGDLVSRIMNDVTAIQNVITSTLMGLASNILIILTTLGLMFEMNWKMTILSLVVVPGFVLPTQRVGGVRQRLQGEIQNKLSALTIQLSEQFGVSGALLTRIFNREPQETSKFNKVNMELRDLQVRQTLVGRWLFMWIGMFSSIGPALLWGYGGWLVIHHQMGLGTIVAFTGLLGRLYGPMRDLAQMQVSLLSSIALFRRIFAILDIEPEVTDGPLTLPDGSVKGRIRIDKVSFAYQTDETQQSNKVLHDIELDIQPGQMIALVGPSGAGKSTLLNLIPRFADPVSGHIYIDNYESKSLTLASLRGQMGLVPQDPFFFHDSIYNNLLFAKPDSERDEIVKACQAAQIHDMIASLPDGYDTIVGERGYRLSGGERQRLAIARVLLRAPQIVLLDEATSALDTLVERQIQEALEVLLKGRTAIIIAHRLSTILTADRIVVLQDGRIAASGKHQELLQKNKLYRELYEAQFALQGV